MPYQPTYYLCLKMSSFVPDQAPTGTKKRTVAYIIAGVVAALLLCVVLPISLCCYCGKKYGK